MDGQAKRDKPRWIYRFDNFDRAFALLREAVGTMESRALTQLEKEGMVQRFGYTWELAWKTLKDYLDSEGVALDKITPASVIRAAFEAKILGDGEGWMRALDARNRMAHTYNAKDFETIVADIRAKYLGLLDALRLFMRDNAAKAEKDG